MSRVEDRWRNLSVPEPDDRSHESPRLPAMANGAIVLPSGDVTISECAGNLFERISKSGSMFVRGGAIMELLTSANGRLFLDIVTPTAFRSRIEKFGAVMAWRIGNNNDRVLKLVSCSEDTAKALLSSTAARTQLHQISMIVDCPIIIEHERGLRVLGRGFHSENSGILVTGPEIMREWRWGSSIAAKLLWLLLSEFEFQSPGDQARAFASLITPALKMGGLLKGRAPLVVTESDQSQAGKTYLQKIIAALYNEMPSVVVSRQGGVGSMEESFAQALVNGRPFIQLDNCRGKIDSPYLESFMTSTGTFPARVPYRPEVNVDPEKFIVMMTSNGVETTRDMANRSCIVRIRKREDYLFRSYPGGDLLEFVKSNQGMFLDCVFSLICDWHRHGKPRTDVVAHDFREWSQVLDWIVQRSGFGPLLTDHRLAQERVSTPALNFVRKLAIALRSSGGLGKKHTASALVACCIENGIEIPGSNSCEEAAAARVLGGVMKRFCKPGEKCIVDSFEIVLTKVRTSRGDGGGAYDANTFEFIELA